MVLTVRLSTAAQFVDRLLYERDLLNRAILSDRERPHKPRWRPVGKNGRVRTGYVPSRVGRLYHRWYPPVGHGPAATLYHAAVAEAAGPGWVDVRQALTAAWAAHQALTNESLNGGGPDGYTWGPAFPTHCEALTALIGLLPAVGTADNEPPTGEVPEPVKLLTSWREILVALGMKDNQEDKGKVSRLNRTADGPIRIPGQGKQPITEKSKLIAWWNGLEAKFATQNRQRDATATVASPHHYGRAGKAVPDIAGGEKKRRKDRKP